MPRDMLRACAICAHVKRKESPPRLYDAARAVDLMLPRTCWRRHYHHATLFADMPCAFDFATSVLIIDFRHAAAT